LEQFLIAGAENDGSPEIRDAVTAKRLVVQQKVAVDINQTSEVVGPFNIAGHPVEGIGYTGEHGFLKG
jgi:hypothetical protein